MRWRKKDGEEVVVVERTLRMSGQGLGSGRAGRNRVLMVKVLGIDGMAEAITTPRIGDRGRGGGGGRKTGRPVKVDFGVFTIAFFLCFIPHVWSSSILRDKFVTLVIISSFRLNSRLLHCQIVNAGERPMGREMAGHRRQFG